MKKEYFESAKRTFSIESKVLEETFASLDEIAFANICDMLFQCKGKVIVSGIGKSGHIAAKIASTFSSTGTPAIFLHPAEAGHGDVGLITKDDILLIISKSGESEELFSLFNTNIPIIAITSNHTSRLAQSAKSSGGVVMNMHISEEACPHGLAPTSSTTAQLVLGDAIAIALLEARNFSSLDFARLHPGGALGRKLSMNVSNLMVSGEELPLIGKESALASVMHEISSKRFGAACVIGEEGELIGIITDGDLRRFFQTHNRIDIHKALDVMSTNPKTTSKDTLAIEALHIMEDTSPKVMQLPVVDERNIVVGMIHLHDIVKAGIN